MDRLARLSQRLVAKGMNVLIVIIANQRDPNSSSRVSGVNYHSFTAGNEMLGEWPILGRVAWLTDLFARGGSIHGLVQSDEGVAEYIYQRMATPCRSGYSQW